MKLSLSFNKLKSFQQAAEIFQNHHSVSTAHSLVKRFNAFIQKNEATTNAQDRHTNQNIHERLLAIYQDPVGEHKTRMRFSNAYMKLLQTASQKKALPNSATLNKFLKENNNYLLQSQSQSERTDYLIANAQIAETATANKTNIDLKACTETAEQAQKLFDKAEDYPSLIQTAQCLIALEEAALSRRLTLGSIRFKEHVETLETFAKHAPKRFQSGLNSCLLKMQDITEKQQKMATPHPLKSQNALSSHRKFQV